MEIQFVQELEQQMEILQMFLQVYLGSGIHYWNVTCTDNAMRNFTSPTFNFNISDTPPNVTLISPNPNYLDNDGNISFTYNVSDNTGFNKL